MRRSLIRTVFVCAAVVFLAGLSKSSFSQGEAREGSLYSQAIKLVLETRVEEISRIEGRDAETDIKEHQWTVVRPFRPGFVDSTRLFSVSYKIDGKIVGLWNVDLRQRTVSKASVK